MVPEEQARLRRWAEQHTDLGLLSSLVQKDTAPWLVSVCEHTDVLRRDVASQLTAKDRAEAAKEYLNEIRVVDPSFRMTARHRRLVARQAAREANDAQAGGGAGDAAGAAEHLARATVAAMAATRPQRRETQPMNDDEDAEGDEIELLPPPLHSASQRAADAITAAGAALHRTSSAFTGLIARLTPRKRTAADMDGGAAHDSEEGMDEGEEPPPAQRPRIAMPLPPVDAKVMEEVSKDRRWAVAAAIVRIMKSCRVVGHTELVAEVTQQLSNMFKADVKLIKKRIEDLINREYIKRDETQANMYHYIP